MIHIQIKIVNKLFSIFVGVILSLLKNKMFVLRFNRLWYFFDFFRILHFKFKYVNGFIKKQLYYIF